MAGFFPPPGNFFRNYFKGKITTKSPHEWRDMLRIEPEFLAIEKEILSGSIRDYRQIPPQAFAYRGWDALPGNRLFDLLLPFLRCRGHSETGSGWPT